MGWSFESKPRDVKGRIREMLTWESGEFRNRCLDVAMSLNVAYAAVERCHKQTGEREVWAAIFLMRYVRGDDPYNWGYKDLTENCGPCEARCPERILALLTPTDNEYAKEWRESCWANIKQRKQSRKLKVGAEIEFDSPVKFTDGFVGQRFRVESMKWGRRAKRVLVGSNGGLYRLRGFNQRTDWKIVGAAPGGG